MRFSVYKNSATSQLLTELYGDKSHFIYEIIQNAEDVNAKQIKFELFDNKIEINHNGIDFTFDKDIKGITRIGNTRKQSEINKLGKFGIGFKSIFAITDSPKIHSGQLHFRIEEMLIPREIPPMSVNGTKFIFPFKHAERTKEVIYEIAENGLENIKPAFLLFLNNIQEIIWKTPNNQNFFKKEFSRVKGRKNIWKTKIKSKREITNYLVFGKPVKFEQGELFVKIAYQLNGEKIIPITTEHFLYVFFETNVRTSLNFLIHAPFRTTPARDNIPFEIPDNLKLIESIAELVAESIETIRDMGKLSVDFFEDILPLEEWRNKGPIYETIYKKVEKLIGEKKVLPGSAKDKFVFANDATITTKELIGLFSKPKDRKILFGKSYFLDAKINQKYTPKLYKYFQQYRLSWKVKEVGIYEVIKKINPAILKEKSDRWLIRLYDLFHKASYWGARSDLKSKQIIRTESGDYIAAFSDGKASVYLPTDVISDYLTVKKNLYKNKRARDFFEWLELRKPRLLDEIETFIIPKYDDENLDVEDEEYLRDFKKLLEADFSLDESEKSELERKLKSTEFVKSVNLKSKKILFRKPEDTYFQEKDLLELFADNENVFFVDELLYKNFDREKIESFLKDCGVNSVLKKRCIPYFLEEKDRLNQTKKWVDFPKKFKDIAESIAHNSRHNFIDFYLDEQYWILIQIWKKKEISFLLWNQLLLLARNFGKGAFQGKYEWRYAKKSDSKSFDSDFIVYLRNERWLTDKNNESVKSSEITVEDLHKDYNTQSTQAKILIEKLHFKADETKKLLENVSPETKEKFEIGEVIKQAGHSLEYIKQLIEKDKERRESQILAEDETSQNQLIEILPKNIPVKITNFTPPNIYKVPRRRIEKSGELKQLERNVENNFAEEMLYSKSDVDKIEVGSWGEEYIFNALKEKYKGNIEETNFGVRITDDAQRKIEIYNLNKEGLGVGCDFEIKIDGKIAEIIEGKSKTEANPVFVRMSGEQWSRAKKEREKYWIYVFVYNEQKTSAEIMTIQDPATKWEKGELSAQVVEIKLRRDKE